MPSQPVPHKPYVRGLSSHERFEDLLAEATALAARIHDELANGEFPAGLNWGHVGSMGETVRKLRDVNDQMFLEGEYAPEPSRKA